MEDLLMEEIIYVPINEVLCDIEVRINNDINELLKNLKVNGQIEPLIVEGPDSKGNYYLISGYRRLESMRSCPELFPLVKCLVLRSLTTTKERNKTRFLMSIHNKKVINVENQIMINKINDPSIFDQLSNSKKRKIRKGLEIPQEERVEAAKHRVSQEALQVIHDLIRRKECTKEYIEFLKERHLNRGISGEHASAINRLIKREIFKRLDIRQKETAIEEAINLAKFGTQDADLIILKLIMSENPHSDLANNWIDYICCEIEKIIDMVNPGLEIMVNDYSRLRINSTFLKIKERFKWALVKSNQDENAFKDNEEYTTSKQNNDENVQYEKGQKTKSDIYYGPRMERHGRTLRFFFEKAQEVFLLKQGQS